MLDTNYNYDYIFKLCVVGDSGVGKSSMLLRFSDNTFIENQYSTIGVDFKQKSLKINDNNVKLSIWDTAGQDRFNFITRAYYKGCNGVLFVFDTTNRQSFLNIQKWFDQVQETAQNSINQVEFLLVGNKADMYEERRVPKQEAEELAQLLNCKYIETSAKNGQNIDKSFINLCTNLVSTIEMIKGKKKKDKNNKNDEQQNQKNSHKLKIKTGDLNDKQNQKNNSTCC
ncbi:P-loop containing nucleoside triphosphate hydrolase [Pseudocohnilembus persalinus]|uniref:p-loop containing nucleoside triphosphate hydrolase n=1 Tax=Pseudocohnilembus persalinus TaxID=266149 RepID=A0A0V0R6C1_PSEPJ|nr:P-loop containing nucleoside triphosphate hydrolase [Pseudocohnilembus persalinus]|eukprot:KRX09704.1 P-loop containing nucleoside triphosphate hydrolase [Pseudocohnilembus persalinus]